MQFLSKLVSHLTLAAACLLGTAAPVAAQVTPIGFGCGSFVAQNQQVHQFAFSLVQRRDGTLCGHAFGYEAATQASVGIELSSYMRVGDLLCVAGTVTRSINMPPQFAVGNTTFFCVRDNHGAPDQFAGLGTVPPQFGNLTIQQIVALIGTPPPQAFSSLLNGFIHIF